jgi:hypothetical protein
VPTAADERLRGASRTACLCKILAWSVLRSGRVADRETHSPSQHSALAIFNCGGYGSGGGGPCCGRPAGWSGHTSSVPRSTWPNATSRANHPGQDPAQSDAIPARPCLPHLPHTPQPHLAQPRHLVIHKVGVAPYVLLYVQCGTHRVSPPRVSPASHSSPTTRAGPAAKALRQAGQTIFRDRGRPHRGRAAQQGG